MCVQLNTEQRQKWKRERPFTFGSIKFSRSYKYVYTNANELRAPNWTPLHFGFYNRKKHTDCSLAVWNRTEQKKIKSNSWKEKKRKGKTIASRKPSCLHHTSLMKRTARWIENHQWTTCNAQCTIPHIPRMKERKRENANDPMQNGTCEISKMEILHATNEWMNNWMEQTNVRNGNEII